MGNPAKEGGGVRVRAHSFKAVRVVRVRAVSGDSGMRRWGKSEEVSVRWNDNAVGQVADERLISDTSLP